MFKLGRDGGLVECDHLGFGSAVKAYRPEADACSAVRIEVNRGSYFALEEKEYRDNVRNQRSQQGESKWHMDIEPDVHHRLVAHIPAYLLQQRGLLAEHHPTPPAHILQLGGGIGLAGIEAGDRGRSR